ncbi:hypothetical protein [Blastococcus sp. SYSU D00695]
MAGTCSLEVDVNRALRAATMGALLLTPVVMTACSAGQVNQTSSQDRDKVGPSAQVGDLELRQVQLANPCEADEDATAYEDGDSPELVLSIVNGGRAADTLTGISGDFFEGVYVGEVPGDTPAAPVTSSAPPAAATTGAPGGTAGSTGAESTGAEATGTGAEGTGTGAEGTGTGAATPAAPTAPAPVTPTERLDVEVPAGEVTTIGLRQYEEGDPCAPEIAADTTRLFLADVSLDEPLTASQTVTLTLTFADAGEVTVPALVAGPAGAVERGEAFDFHHEEEGAEGGNEQDTESE